jgi:hypothetical protein
MRRVDCQEEEQNYQDVETEQENDFGEMEQFQSNGRQEDDCYPELESYPENDDDEDLGPVEDEYYPTSDTVGVIRAVEQDVSTTPVLGPSLYCTVNVFGQKIEALVDSGASASMIFPEVLEKLRETDEAKIIIDQTLSTDVPSMNHYYGERLRIHHRVTLPLEVGLFEKCKAQVVFLCDLGSPYPMLLGTNALQELGFDLRIRDSDAIWGCPRGGRTTAFPKGEGVEKTPPRIMNPERAKDKENFWRDAGGRMRPKP